MQHGIVGIKPGKFKSDADAGLVADKNMGVNAVVDIQREIIKDTGELPF